MAVLWFIYWFIYIMFNLYSSCVLSFFLILISFCYHILWWVKWFIGIFCLHLNISSDQLFRNFFCSGKVIIVIFFFLAMVSHINISSLSSSCRAASTDIPDPLSTHIPIVHRLWLVFRATSCILTLLLNVCSNWSSCFCPAICGGL